MGNVETQQIASIQTREGLYAGIEGFGGNEWVEVDPDVVSRMYDDEFTMAMEAATFGVIMVTHQYWQDGGFFAHGQSVEQIIVEGVQAADDFNSIEVKRRQIEFHEEMDVKGRYFMGMFDFNDKLVISPFPDEMSEESARHLGYYPDKKIAMIRLHTVDNVGNKRILQIALENSDLTLFSQLLAEYGVDLGSDPTSVDILASHLQSEPQVGVGGVGLLQIAKHYDELLHAKYGKQFFLGREIGGNGQEVDYADLEQRRKIVESQSRDYIEGLVNFRLEIERNKSSQVIDGQVYSRLLYSLSNSQALGMSYREVEALRLSVESGKLSALAGDTLLKFERRRVWSLFLAKFDTERAQVYFSQDDIDYFKNLQAPHFNEEAQAYTDTVLIDSQLVFYYCGGRLEAKEYNNGFDCPNCGRFIKHGSGDVCPNCHHSKQDEAMITGEICV